MGRHGRLLGWPDDRGALDGQRQWYLLGVRGIGDGVRARGIGAGGLGVGGGVLSRIGARRARRGPKQVSPDSTAVPVTSEGIAGAPGQTVEPAARPAAEGRVSPMAASAPAGTGSDSGAAAVPSSGWPAPASHRASTAVPVLCVGGVIRVAGPDSSASS